MNAYLPNMWSSIKSDLFDRQIDRMFDEVLGQSQPKIFEWVPSSNVWEDEGGFHVQVALPGWEANEFTLEVNDGMLAVAGQHAAETGLPDIVRREFSLTFRLPESVNSDRAKAVYSRGLLTISFRKRREAKPRRILIEVA